MGSLSGIPFVYHKHMNIRKSKRPISPICPQCVVERAQRAHVHVDYILYAAIGSRRYP